MMIPVPLFRSFPPLQNLLCSLRSFAACFSIFSIFLYFVYFVVKNRCLSVSICGLFFRHEIDFLECQRPARELRV
jgi:hypothetical protein